MTRRSGSSSRSAARGSTRRSRRAWAARAQAELAALGQRVQRARRRGAVWTQLSAVELQVAQLATRGLANREIGERLYLSHRTVAAHRYRIFPKLGIGSRTELPGVLPEG